MEMDNKLGSDYFQSFCKSWIFYLISHTIYNIFEQFADSIALKGAKSGHHRILGKIFKI